MVCLSLKFFKGYLPQILLGPFLNILFQMWFHRQCSFTAYFSLSKSIIVSKRKIKSLISVYVSYTLQTLVFNKVLLLTFKRETDRFISVPRKHLPEKSRQYKHKKKVWNKFQVYKIINLGLTWEMTKKESNNITYTSNVRKQAFLLMFPMA